MVRGGSLERQAVKFKPAVSLQTFSLVAHHCARVYCGRLIAWLRPWLIFYWNLIIFVGIELNCPKLTLDIGHFYKQNGNCFSLHLAIPQFKALLILCLANRVTFFRTPPWCTTRTATLSTCRGAPTPPCSSTTTTTSSRTSSRPGAAGRASQTDRKVCPRWVAKPGSEIVSLHFHFKLLQRASEGVESGRGTYRRVVKLLPRVLDLSTRVLSPPRR